MESRRQPRLDEYRFFPFDRDCSGRDTFRLPHILAFAHGYRHELRILQLAVIRGDGGGFGLGFRVPLIVLSPYAKPHTVWHQPGEFDSILRFIEDNWHLKPLTQRDATAPSLRSVFDFGQTPTPKDPLPMRTDCHGPKWTITG